MKIGIMSDSHDNMIAIQRAVDLFNKEKVEKVFHAGDIVSPFTADVFKKLQMPMTCVFGNNDGEKIFLKQKFENIADIVGYYYDGEIFGKKIVVMHEPRSVDAISSSGVYDIIIYGHTHKIDVRKEKTLIVNPGESSGWISNLMSVAVCDLSSMEVEIKYL